MPLNRLGSTRSSRKTVTAGSPAAAELNDLRMAWSFVKGHVDTIREMLAAVDPSIPLFLGAHGQDQILDGGIGPRGCSWSVRAIVPIDAVEPLSMSVVDPVMDGRLAHVELLGDHVLGATAPDCGDDRSATQRLPIIFRLMATSGERCGFSVQDTTE
jgi:hypothetical protein